MPEVPRISALLSDEARRGWRRVCEAHDVKLSPLLEALGQLADEGREWDVLEAVDLARIIYEERMSRGGWDPDDE